MTKFLRNLLLLSTLTFLFACTDGTKKKSSNDDPTPGAGNNASPQPMGGMGGAGGQVEPNPGTGGDLMQPDTGGDANNDEEPIDPRPNPGTGGSAGEGDPIAGMGGNAGESGQEPEEHPCEGETPNGTLDPNEECDDGNQENGDGCTNTCESVSTNISENGNYDKTFLNNGGERTHRLHRYTFRLRNPKELSLTLSSEGPCPAERYSIELYKLQDNVWVEIDTNPQFPANRNRCVSLLTSLSSGRYELTFAHETAENYALNVSWSDLLAEGDECDFDTEENLCGPELVCRLTPEDEYQCLEPGCGDGVVNTSYDFDLGRSIENCEDGNLNDGDGCSSECLLEGRYIPPQSGSYTWGEANNTGQTFHLTIPDDPERFEERYYGWFQLSGPNRSCPWLADALSLNVLSVRKRIPQGNGRAIYELVDSNLSPNHCPPPIETELLTPGDYEIATSVSENQGPLFLHVRLIDMTDERRELASIGQPCDENELNRACEIGTRCIQIEQVEDAENWRCVPECWDRTVPQNGAWKEVNQCDPYADNASSQSPEDPEDLCDNYCSLKSYDLDNTNTETTGEEPEPLHFRNGRSFLDAQIVEPNKKDQYKFFGNEGDTLKVKVEKLLGENEPNIRLTYPDVIEIQLPLGGTTSLPIEETVPMDFDPATQSLSFTLPLDKEFTLHVPNENDTLLRYNIHLSLFHEVSFDEPQLTRKLHQGMTDVFFLDLSRPPQANETTLYTKLDCENGPNPISGSGPAIELVEVSENWLDRFEPLRNPSAHFQFTTYKTACEHFKIFNPPPGFYELRVHTHLGRPIESPPLRQFDIEISQPECTNGRIDSGEECTTPGQGNCDSACSTVENTSHSSDVERINALPAQRGARDVYIIKGRAHYTHFDVKIREHTLSNLNTLRIWASYDRAGNNRVLSATSNPDLGYPNLQGTTEENEGMLPNLMDDVFIQVENTLGQPVPFYRIEILSAAQFKDVDCNFDLQDFAVGAFDYRCQDRENTEYADELRNSQHAFAQILPRDRIRFELQTTGNQRDELTQNLNLSLLGRNNSDPRQLRVASLRKIATRIYDGEQRGQLVYQNQLIRNFGGNVQNIAVNDLHSGIYEIIVEAINPENANQTFPYSVNYLVEPVTE